jgi:hypothetical protein
VFAQNTQAISRSKEMGRSLCLTEINTVFKVKGR